jgi:hypothetical protein
MFNNFFFFENGAVNEIKWKNIVERARPQVTTWHTRIACWIAKATNTHSQVACYSLLFHCNKGCTDARKCYVLRTFAVLFTYPTTELFLLNAELVIS